jgi:Ni/Co efflux regulator RcnB
LQDIAAARQDQYRGPLATLTLPAPRDPAAGIKAGLRNTRIGKKRKQPTYAQWKRGDVLSALVGKAKSRQMMGRI